MVRKPNSVDLQGLNLNLKNYMELPPVFTTEFNQWDVSGKENIKNKI